MKAIVRDDIISLNSFVSAEFKYKYYLEMLKESGNYCFLDQFKKLVPKGQSIINGMLENNLIALENINNNYKYIYLTDTAMKFLYLRDSEEDFKDITKNRISVKKVNKNPSEKQLLTSAYKFHLNFIGEPLISKQDIKDTFTEYIYLSKFNHSQKYVMGYCDNIESKAQKIQDEINHLEIKLRDFNSTVKGIFDSSINNINGETAQINAIENELKLLRSKHFEKAGLFNKHDILIQTKQNEKEVAILEERLSSLKKFTLFKKSLIHNHKTQYTQYTDQIESLKANLNKLKKRYIDIINNSAKLDATILKVHREVEKLYDISKVIVRIVDSKLELLIFDAGNFKTAFGYLKLINSLNEFELPYEDITIIIYSYAEHRALNLENEFNKLKKDKLNALKTTNTFNIKTNNYYDKPSFYLAADSLYKSIPDFNIEVRDTFYYMKKYKELISNSNKYIKKKDKETINMVIQKLNSQ